MFQVPRYDPTTRRTKSKKSKKRVRTKDRQDDHQDTTSLRVIAPDVSSEPVNAISAQQFTAVLAEEGFDDLSLDWADKQLIDDSENKETGQQVDIETPYTKGTDKKAKTEEKRRGNETSNDPSQMTLTEVQQALQMSQLPIQEAAKQWDLAPFLVDNLLGRHDDTTLSSHYQHFFPIQALVIPNVIATERYKSHIRVQDVCITAPTGSGKTLSYVLPILNSLSQRQIPRLRALVVLPSRDLANQVYQVFQQYVRGSNLRVGRAIGQSDFVAEQIALTVPARDDDHQSPFGLSFAKDARLRLQFDPGNVQLALEAFAMESDYRAYASSKPMATKKGESAVDILVCTPGRLVDHLDNTPDFTLQHLRFLVVDEADRLLNQRYHNWVERVIQSANSASISAHKELAANGHQLPDLQPDESGTAFVLDPITWRRGGVHGDDSTTFNTNDSFFSVASSVCQPVQLRKFLVSATLTHDPRKLAAMHLVNPKHFNMHQINQMTSSDSYVRDVSGNKYSMPEALKEYFVECTAEQKPLVLLALLLERSQLDTNEKHSIIVVFTSSLDSTHRLVRLLQLLWTGYGNPSEVCEFSSAVTQKERSHLMKRCNGKSNDDKVAVVVCSDGMSRGMDIENVNTVINYDVPSFAKTYVHRCGRTARAGRTGSAITLLKGGQVAQFFKMRGLIQASDNVQGIGVKKGLLKDVIPKYRKCIGSLRKVLEAEARGDLRTTDACLDDFIDKSASDNNS